MPWPDAIIKRDVFVIARIYDCAFFGTLAPFFRASESPIAIACLRFLTAPPLPPFPERRVPFFSRRTALSTDLPAALPYLRLLDFLREPAFFRVAISSSHVCVDRSVARNACLRCDNNDFRCHGPSPPCCSNHPCFIRGRTSFAVKLNHALS
jgi:hypothetical protein